MGLGPWGMQYVSIGRTEAINVFKSLITISQSKKVARVMGEREWRGGGANSKKKRGGTG